MSATDRQARAAIQQITDNSVKVQDLTDPQKESFLNALFPNRVHLVANGDLQQIRDKDGNVLFEV